MSLTLAELADRLVPVSEFSQGKSSKIFSDVYDNNKEYIVLRNNVPTVVIVSFKEYKDIQEKASKFEKLLETIENFRLLSTAKSRGTDGADSFYDFLKSEGLSIEELEEISESVEIE
ncbi:MAG: type II toxin-antitoxin system Phd/YefM family antitoxin [Phascolarctobacterium sp.]|nr:type II toxin-antitoxin system Phd/YefM family antitoxin [Phascolarctobacterium sp.]